MSKETRKEKNTEVHLQKNFHSSRILNSLSREGKEKPE